MNSIYKLYNMLLFLSISSIALHAQVCRDITISLDADGFYELLEKDIIHPIYQTEEHITYSPSEFTCDDIGTHQVKVLIYTDTDTYIHCTSIVTVEDGTPPEAKCFSNLHVVLDGQGQYEFVPQGINLQSSDGCSPVGIRFFPPRVKCTDPSPMNVLVVVRDESDNRDTCYMMVTWDPYPGPSEPIACRDSLIFKMNWLPEIVLTPDIVLQDILYGCPGDYVIEVFDGVSVRPQPVITIADTNAMLTVTIKDTVNGIQCSAPIIVLTNIYCDKPVLVCDVVCHSAPPGDCASGHTLYDEVEWPCDLVIDGACPFDEIYPTPDNLIWYGLADSSDVFPVFGFESCFFSGFYDEETEFPTHKIFQRNWTVVNWANQESHEYVQTITLQHDLTEICDTQPWTAPTGDCDSGHSLSDDVEWPADITIHTHFASPEQLAKNDAVHSQNVKPELSIGCNVAEATYTDVVTEVNDNTLLVQRTWVIQDMQSLQIWQYVQHITIIRNGPGSVVCVTREHGQAIPNVQLAPGIQTDVTGCHVFNNPAGVIVTPVKDEDLRLGVNINDQIAIREFLLGSRNLSPYQQYAADVNQDGMINEADLHAIDQIISGTFIPPFAHSWAFFEIVTQASFADISSTLAPHYFIGVKIGDVIIADGEEEIYVWAEDEVLNEGEMYDIPFYLDRKEYARAFGLYFISPGNKVEFISVEAPQVPGFSIAHYHITADFLSMVWLALPPHFDDGALIVPDQPFLMVRLKANENTILHEAIAIGPQLTPEFIPPSRPPYYIRLLWDEAIVSSTLDLADGRQLKFYPNPMTNEMYIQGLTDQDQGFITLINSAGQIVQRSPLQEILDVSSIHEGIYFVSVFVDEKFSKPVSVVKIQH